MISLLKLQIFIATIAFFAFSPHTTAQLIDFDTDQNPEKRAEFYKKLLWDTPQEGFNDTIIPEKWKNESLVYICSSTELLIDYEMGKMKYYTFHHNRVKLQDINAVSNYSEFSFRDDFKSKGLFQKVIANYHVGYKIIKPDGTEHEVNVNDAVEKSMQQGRDKLTINKVAVPDLELGDIVDYYYITEVKFPVSKFYAMSPDWYPLVDEYPIKKQYLTIHVGPNVYLNAKSVNKAPELSLVNKNARFSSFALIDSMRDKITDNIHFRMATELPHVKFQGYFTSLSSSSKAMGNLEAYMLLDHKKLNRQLNPDKLKDITVFLSKDGTNYWGGTVDYYSNYIKATNNYLTSVLDKKDFDKSKLVKEAYYFLREYNFRTQLLKVASNGKISPYVYSRPLDLFSANHVLAAVFKNWGVPFNFVYTVPNSISKLDDWLFFDELTPLLEVLANDTFLIADFGSESFINQMPREFSGNKAYRVSVFNDDGKFLKKGGTLDTITLKKNTPEDFKSNLSINMKISDFTSPASLNFAYNMSKGDRMTWDTLMVSGYDSFKDENMAYSPFIISPTINPSKWSYAIAGLSDYQNKFEKDRSEQLTQLMQLKLSNESFSLDSVYVNNIGRWEEQAELKFGFNAHVSNLYTKIGDNYLLDIGSILGNKFLDRPLDDSVSFDFQTNGPFIFEQTLNLTLPDGYTIKDVQKLNLDFANDCGSIQVKAQVISDTIEVSIVKTLNEQFYPKEKWKEYTSFMKESIQIGMQQVVIEKK